jgi:transposase
MKRERRDFDKEFKMMAVNICYTGKSTKEIVEEFGIRTDLVRRWKREYEEYREGSFSGQGNLN